MYDCAQNISAPEFKSINEIQKIQNYGVVMDVTILLNNVYSHFVKII
jgi:hypothetical protein